MSLFEILEKEHGEEHKSRTSQNALIIAGQRVSKRFGNFLSKAGDREEYESRLAFVEPEIGRIVRDSCKEQEYPGNPRQIRAGLTEYLEKFYSADEEDDSPNTKYRCPHCGSHSIATVSDQQGHEVIKCESCGKRSYGDPANNSVRKEITAADAPEGADKATQHKRVDPNQVHDIKGYPSEANREHDMKPLDVGSLEHPHEYQDVEEHERPKNLKGDERPIDFIKREYDQVDITKPIGDTEAIGTKTYGDTPNAARPVTADKAGPRVYCPNCNTMFPNDSTGGNYTRGTLGTCPNCGGPPGKFPGPLQGIKEQVMWHGLGKPPSRWNPTESKWHISVDEYGLPEEGEEPQEHDQGGLEDALAQLAQLSQIVQQQQQEIEQLKAEADQMSGAAGEGVVPPMSMG